MGANLRLYDAHVFYTCPLSVYEWEAFDVPLALGPDPRVETARLFSKEGILLIEIMVRKVSTPFEARDAANTILEELLGRLMVALRRPIGHDQYVRTDMNPLFERSPGDDQIIWSEGIPSSEVVGTGTLTVTINSAQQQAMTESLAQAQLPGGQYYSLYHRAMRVEDAVCSYLLFYQILLFLFNDKQKDVDAFIVKQFPNVPTSPNPQNGKPETIFTRLRNEIGHRRIGVNLDQSLREMEQRRHQLLELVAEALKQQPLAEIA